MKDSPNDPQGITYSLKSLFCSNKEFVYVLLLSCSGSLFYVIHKYIAKILKDYGKDEDKAKNSTMFSNYIINVSIEDGKIMVSFDIPSLYTNIPISDVLSIVKDYLNNDDQFTRKMAVPQDKFLDLANLVLTTT